VDLGRCGHFMIGLVFEGKGVAMVKLIISVIHFSSNAEERGSLR
jgi:hypothetical protein